VRCALDADIMREAGINDSNRCELHPQCSVLIAGIAAVWRRVSFSGSSELLIMLSFASSVLDRVLNWPIQVT